MKKTLLLTLEWPPMKGGIAEYLRGLFGAMPQDRVAVRHSKWLEKGMRRLAWALEIPATAWAVWRTKAETLVISHLLPMGYVALVLKLAMGLPFVVIVHGTDLRRARTDERKRKWARIVLSHAHGVAANSLATREAAEAAGADPNRIRIVHPCPSDDAWREPTDVEISELRRQRGLEGRRVLLSVGRLAERKDLARVARLLPRIRERCGDVVYVVVGEGPERGRIERAAREAGAGEHVLLAGPASGRELSVWYGAADVFITVPKELPDDVEGFGIVYLEAALHRLPVVGGKTGGVPEAVHDGTTGILVPPEDDEAVLGAVCRLFEDRELAARMGEAGRRRVEAGFTWERQARRFMELLS